MYEVKRKRKKGFVTALLVFLCAFSVGLGIGYGGVKMGILKGREPQPEPQKTVQTPIPDRQASAGLAEEAEQTQSPTASPKPGFFIRVEGDKVCVFTLDEEGKKRFSYNLPIELGDLREEDQKLFLEGITIGSKEELLSFIEDFSS